MRNNFVHTLLLSLVLVIIYLESFAQAFTDAGVTLPGISRGVCLWGDYDGDHDPDILLSGKKNDGSAFTAIFTNTGGTFTQLGQDFLGLERCQGSWVDLENDGDLDIALTGFTVENRMYIFRNDGGTFTELNHGIGYFGEYSDMAWSDFDNDGDADLVISGSWQTKIYFNEGNYTFTGHTQNFAQLNNSRISVSDIDGDRDHDILLSGDTGAGMTSNIYLNDAGTFSLSSAIITGLSAGSSDWGDYDSDGDADLLITGFDDMVSAQSFIYQNNGNLSFSKINAGLTPVSLGNVAWADFDTDGDHDFLLTGKVDGCGTFVSQVYKNEGDQVFSAIFSGLTNAEYSYGSWADYDGDGDLDIVLCGSGTAGSFTKIFRNDSGLPDFLPSVPQNLQSSLDGNSVILSWDKSTDTETPQDGLTYNIRVGTYPGGSDIVNASAMDDGYRLLTQAGNTALNNSWILYNLEQGTYYWSVQALDNSFAGSGFSDEAAFTITATSIADLYGLSESLLISGSNGFIQIHNMSTDIIGIRVYTPEGKHQASRQAQAGEIVHLMVSPGLYLAEVNSASGKKVTKVVVR